MRSDGVIERRSIFIKQIFLESKSQDGMAPSSCNSQPPMARPWPLTCCPCVPVPATTLCNAATLGPCVWLAPCSSHHACWRLQRHVSKSEDAGGNGDTSATWHVPAESANGGGVMHGVYVKKEHHWGISLETTPFGE